jgi:hypothetical protein
MLRALEEKGLLLTYPGSKSLATFESILTFERSVHDGLGLHDQKL